MSSWHSDSSTELLDEAEYLLREETAFERSEYIDGRLFLMVGESLEHALIVTNLAGELGNRLRGGPCRPLSSKMRIRVPDHPRYFYPDVVVYCGQPELLGKKPNTLLNPTLLVEVLSESTEAHDRGEKWFHLQGIASLQEYVLVSQVSSLVEIYRRDPAGGWHYSSHAGAEATATFGSLGVELPLRDIYEGVEFAAGAVVEAEAV